MSVLPSDGVRRYEIRPPAVPEPKNCFRCGLDFVDYSGSAKVCRPCLKPKIQKLRGAAELLGLPLTHRERQIAEGIRWGKPNKEIAGDLHLAVGSVKVYVSHILAKTGTANRTVLAVWWALTEQVQ